MVADCPLQELGEACSPGGGRLGEQPGRHRHDDWGDRILELVASGGVELLEPWFVDADDAPLTLPDEGFDRVGCLLRGVDGVDGRAAQLEPGGKLRGSDDAEACGPRSCEDRQVVFHFRSAESVGDAATDPSEVPGLVLLGPREGDRDVVPERIAVPEQADGVAGGGQSECSSQRDQVTRPVPVGDGGSPSGREG